MKEYKAMFSWNDLVELGLGSHNTYFETDDDRRHEVTDKSEHVEVYCDRYFWESKKGWLEFIFDDIPEGINYWRDKSDMGAYSDGEFKIDRNVVEKIILNPELPMELKLRCLE